MKVLKGFFQGVELAVPEGGVVRPTVDHFKKHILRIAEEVNPRVVWDLFAGCGGVGLELLSQGAEVALFVEQWGRAADCIRSNLGESQIKNAGAFSKLQTQVLVQSVQGFLKNTADYKLEKNADLIFLDPPYGENIIQKVLPLLFECSLMTDKTKVIIEHVTAESLGDYKTYAKQVTQEVYGPKTLTVLVRR